MREGLTYHKSQGERWVIRFSLTISVENIFLETGEGIIETEEEFVSREFVRIYTKGAASSGGLYRCLLHSNGSLFCL